MEASQIIVYLDEGVDPHSFRLIVRAVRKALPESFVRSVDRHYFLTGQWEKVTQLVIFPGGRDLPYDRALRGEGNRRIRQFVEAGGSYLGICAGGYYGASSIRFEEGGELEVCGQRELAFFPGVAKGPIYGPGQFRYNSLDGARIAKVAWIGGIAPVYFNGGCAFVEGEGEVLATYDDLEGGLPAAVRCQIGKGRALLCGVHPEYDLKGTPDHLRSQIASAEGEREAFWKYILERSLN